MAAPPKPDRTNGATWCRAAGQCLRPRAPARRRWRPASARRTDRSTGRAFAWGRRARPIRAARPSRSTSSFAALDVGDDRGVNDGLEELTLTELGNGHLRADQVCLQRDAEGVE